ncbi:hypothetical protein CISIN_1g043674mg [Citrus sinensis]|uniref:NAB domain-containing protein n=1 Tax=Citrus sinensis TaxID=2711 RepID=A0A067GNC0_CITSI|nr:hypothetical protein CISIN_1g043674mg [Citrus sinensis]
MEEKVGEMLKIIDDDGDSFAQRAEMYYRKRPELINFVEDSYRSYRALAERYDHLSKELQSANRTIATVFPEQVQFAMDAEDEENQGVSSPSNKAAFKPNANIPNVPAIPKKDFMTPFLRMAKKGLKGNSSSAKAAAAAVSLKSGLNKEEALEEIDKLQKGILGLQTEKEFAKSSYERGYEKYWEIEDQITEMQAKVCNLQDEFGIGTVIDDNEARTLIAATAVKSCQDTLSKLQEKQEQSLEEAKTEQQRIIEAHEKFIKLRNRFIVNQTDEREQEQPWEENENKTTAGSELKADLAPQGKSDVELSSKKIEDQVAVDSNESLAVTQLVEKIDELVDKVVNLESAVSSQTALVKTLRSETDQLEGHISRLEGEKESLIADSDATSSADYLSEKLQSGKIEEDVENAGLFPEVKAISDAKNEKDDNILTSGAEKEEEENDTVKAQREDNDSGPSDKPDEKKFMSETASVNLDTEPDEPGIEEGEETPNWRMLSSGLEDREKILLEEYTSVLHNYTDVRRKLSVMEKKNRDRFIELALQIRELENAVAFRDEEIHALRQKLGTVSHTSLHETMDTHTSLTESHQEQEQEESHESITQTTATPVSHFSFLGSSQQPAPSSSEHIYDYRERIDLKKYPKREQSKVNVKHVKIHCTISPIEEKIRADIDELLEENLEFWLRFSTSVHQIQKYQSTVQDLKAELARLKDKKKQEGSAKQRYTKSDARPIYKHLREIQTELTLWLENNEVLKDEVQDRYTSLCNIQEEVSRVANASASASAKAEDAELSNYQAAKFQGEIMNMKQENKKIADELHAGLDCVKQLRVEVEKTLAKLDEQLRHHPPMRSSSTRARIPLHSFLFGVKLKKQGQKQKPSLFSCMSPALQRQDSDHAPARCPQ